MYINSRGGSVTAGLAIYDTMQVPHALHLVQCCFVMKHKTQHLLCAMQYIRSPIATLCIGQAASMASLLLCAGEHGERRSLPNSRIMLHQPSGGSQVSVKLGMQFCLAKGLAYDASFCNSTLQLHICSKLCKCACRAKPATLPFKLMKS